VSESARGEEPVEVELTLLPELDDLDELLDGTFTEGPNVSRPLHGINDVAPAAPLLLIWGAVLLDRLLDRLLEAQCRKRWPHGLVIDATSTKVKVKVVDQLRAGLVQVIAEDGTYAYDACKDRSKVLDLVRSARLAGR